MRPAAPLRFRPDIEGLRAVAVALVVAHHLEWPGAGAGFIGVDVFFVISGFLIARKLLDESDATGSVHVLSFWAGRIRRLLPLATLVVLSTLLASFLILNPMHWHEVVDEARAGALFYANEHFARADQGYFATGTRESPFLHLWSLGVEEQFYVVLPLALMLSLRLRRDRGSLEMPILVVTALCSISLIVAAELTSAASEFAYYSLAARGWELGAGVLLALAWKRVSGVPTALQPWLARFGIAVLIAGLVVIDRRAGFPAWGALYPVVATVLLIAARPSGTLLGRALAARPVRAVGRWSYGWYLWHWPALVLGRAVLGTGVLTSVALAAGSLALAAATHALVEAPARRSRVPAGRTVVLGGAALAVTLLSVTAAAAVDDRYFDPPARRALKEASTDWVDIPVACIGVQAESLLASCAAGAASDEPPLLLYGDSHMSHWRPALEAAAEDLGRPLVHSIQGNCFPYGDGQVDPPPFCDLRAAGFESLIDRLQPTAVVVSTATVYRNLRDGDVLAADQIEAWEDAVYGLATGLRTRRVPLLFFLDTPRYETYEPLECMAEHGPAPRCALTHAGEVQRQGPVNAAIRAGLARAHHGMVFDPMDITCPGERCMLVDGDIVVPQDGHHVTATWSKTQAPVFGKLLGELLEQPARSRSE